MIFANLPAVFFCHNITDRFQSKYFGRAVGVDVKDVYTLRQMLFRVGEDLFRKSVEIDPGCKADAVIPGNIGVQLCRHIDQIDIFRFSDGIQQALRVAMMFGIVNDSCFHNK